MITVQYCQTPAGLLKVEADGATVYTAVYVDQAPPGETITTLPSLTPAFESAGTPFEQSVWRAAYQIPAGSTMTYQQLAAHIDKPKAFRAVANALGKNPIAYIVPCHRVIRQDGTLGGYKWGVTRKKHLLHAERLAYMLAHAK